MAEHLEIKVVTKDPSDIKIFQNGVKTNKNDFVDFMMELTENGWVLVASHAYVRNDYIYEKYYFIRK